MHELGVFIFLFIFFIFFFVFFFIFFCITSRSFNARHARVGGDGHAVEQKMAMANNY
jgi:heme/copper-type cytochrome/quinol oxidase subunit 2